MLKRMKSSQRSLLNDKTLDDFTMIHMNSKESSSFDPSPPIDVWFAKKQRYIKQLDYENPENMTQSESETDWKNESNFSDSSSLTLLNELHDSTHPSKVFDFSFVSLFNKY